MRQISLFFIVLLLTIGTALAQVDEGGLGLAESLINQGRLDDAEKLAVRALETDPESLEARLILAKIAITRGQLEEAQRYVDQLMEGDSSNPDHHVLQAMVYMFSERDQEAIQSVRQALKLGKDKASPEQMASYSNTLVLALYKVGEKDEAMAICLGAIEDYPEDADLYLSASRLYREQEKYQEALEVAEAGLRVNPDFPGLYASVALAQAGLGNTEASEAAYQELLKRSPELARALRATLDGNRPDEAEYKVRTH